MERINARNVIFPIVNKNPLIKIIVMVITVSVIYVLQIMDLNQIIQYVNNVSTIKYLTIALHGLMKEKNVNVPNVKMLINWKMTKRHVGNVTVVMI